MPTRYKTGYHMFCLAKSRLLWFTVCKFNNFPFQNFSKYTAEGNIDVLSISVNPQTVQVFALSIVGLKSFYFGAKKQNEGRKLLTKTGPFSETCRAKAEKVLPQLDSKVTCNE